MSNNSAYPEVTPRSSVASFSPTGLLVITPSPISTTTLLPTQRRAQLRFDGVAGLGPLNSRPVPPNLTLLRWWGGPYLLSVSTGTPVGTAELMSALGGKRTLAFTADPNCRLVAAASHRVGSSGHLDRLPTFGWGRHLRKRTAAQFPCCLEHGSGLRGVGHSRCRAER
jgi:hypothetical protein